MNTKDYLKLKDYNEQPLYTEEKNYVEAVYVTKAEKSMFAEFVSERMEAFHARQKGCQYVSRFDCINTVRFTNPYRMLDRVSQFLIQEIICNDKFAQDSIEQLYHIYLFRVFNEPETYKGILTHLDLLGYNSFALSQFPGESIVEQIVHYVDNRKSRGINVFRPAYKRNTSKPFVRYLDTLVDFNPDDSPFVEEVFNSKKLCDLFLACSKLEGFGPFLSYQLALDFQYTGMFSSDVDFVVPGPGAKRGLEYLYGSLHMREMIRILKILTKHQMVWLGEYWRPYVYIEEDRVVRIPLEENDVQNLFCEYSKFYNSHIFKANARRKLYSTPEALEIKLPCNLFDKYVI
jgi:hypothetical protein